MNLQEIEEKLKLYQNIQDNNIWRLAAIKALIDMKRELEWKNQ